MEQLPKRLKENKYLLYALHKAKPQMRKAIIRNSNSGLIKTLAEISLNTLKGNIEQTPDSKKKLKKYKRGLRCLACSKRSVLNKRNILVQQGGFLPVLLGSLLSGIIGKLLENNGK